MIEALELHHALTIVSAISLQIILNFVWEVVQRSRRNEVVPVNEKCGCKRGKCTPVNYACRGLHN